MHCVHCSRGAELLTCPQDISYSPDGRFIAAWDSYLTYKLLVYTETGQCVANFTAYSDALGIRSVNWSPPGDVISIGSYDQARRRTYSGRVSSASFCVQTVLSQCF